MKICNGIKSYEIADPSDQTKSRLNKLRRNRSKRKAAQLLARRPKSVVDDELIALSKNVENIPPSAFNSQNNTTTINDSNNNNTNNNNNLNSNASAQPDTEKDREANADFQTVTEYPANYFDTRRRNIHYWDKFHNLNENNFDDYEFEYGEIISEEFRKVFDKYDGTLTADQFIKQQLPPPQYYLPRIQTRAQTSRQSHPQTAENSDATCKDSLDPASNSSDYKDSSATSGNQEDSGISTSSNSQRPKTSASPQNKFEMYHILKRMMVKKKYALATVKLEKEGNKQKPRLKRATSNFNAQTNALKSRPTTAAMAASMIDSKRQNYIYKQVSTIGYSRNF